MAELKIFHFLAFFVLLNIELISSQENTLAAIDIKTKNIKFVKTSTPLTVTQSVRQTSRIINTGTTLTSTTFQRNLATIYGGLLNDTYLFCSDEFFWNLEIQPTAGITIDGRGSEVQVLLTFSKGECDNPKDFVQMVIFIFVETNTSAPSFNRFESIVNRVPEAGSSTIGSEYFVCLWFFSNFSNQKYYVYTASNGAIVIVVPNLGAKFAHNMSIDQFYKTFGVLLNSAGEHYSHIAPHTTAPRRIIGSQGVNVKTTL